MNGLWRPGRYVKAPPPPAYPPFGLRNWQRFRQVMDSRGAQYDADFFTYQASFTGQSIAPDGTLVAQVNFDNDSAFELMALTGGVDDDSGAPGIASNFYPTDITLIDQVSSRSLMNSRVPFPNLIGNAQFPFILPTTRRFMPSTQLTAVFHNWASNSETLENGWLVLHGRKLFLPGLSPNSIARFNSWTDQITGARLCEDFFAYDFYLPSYAAGTDVSINLLIEAESDFEWIMTTTSAWDNSEGDTPTANLVTSQYYQSAIADGPISLNFLVNIKDGSSGRYLMNQPIPIADYAGYAEFPFILPQPRIWPAATPIVLELTQAANASAESNFTDFHFTMIGRKIFEETYR